MFIALFSHRIQFQRQEMIKKTYHIKGNKLGTCGCVQRFLYLYLVALPAVISLFIVIFHSVEQYFIEIQRFKDVDH